MEFLNSPLLAGRYFFPRPTRFDPVTLVTAGEATLSCWRSGPRPSGWSLVFFHGNGETVADWLDGPLPALAQQADAELFLAEYRGYGASTGAPRLLAMLDDVAAVRGALGGRDARTVVFGRSVGSLFAIEWVRRFPETAGLVLESGIHDVHERLRLRVHPSELGVSEEAFLEACRQRFPFTEALGAWGGATLVLHTDDDELVDVSHALRNAAAARRATLRRYPRGGHNGILAYNRAQYAADLVAFLRSLRTPRTG